MIAILKLAGVSAVMSAGLVTAFEAPHAVGNGQPKIYQDRIAPEAAAPVVLADAGLVGPAVASDAAPDCRAQTWPYVSPGCVRDGGPVRKVVRTITVERRDAPATSTLVRIPIEAPARR